MMTWGDVILAHKSTGIPNIENYLVLPPETVKQMDLTDRIRPLFRLPFVRDMARKQLRGGATAEEREQTETAVWGEVTDDAGGSAVARLHGRRAASFGRRQLPSASCNESSAAMQHLASRRHQLRTDPTLSSMLRV